MNSYIEIKQEIEKLEISNKEHPELREAHKALAREVITFLHGKEEFEKAQRMAESLFQNKFNDLTKEEIKELFSGNEIKAVTVNTNILDLLISIGAATSKREAREFVTGNAISINGNKINDVNLNITDNDFIDNAYIIVKRGKKNYYLGEKNNH